MLGWMDGPIARSLMPCPNHSLNNFIIFPARGQRVNNASHFSSCSLECLLEKEHPKTKKPKTTASIMSPSLGADAWWSILIKAEMWLIVFFFCCSWIALDARGRGEGRFFILLQFLHWWVDNIPGSTIVISLSAWMVCAKIWSYAEIRRSIFLP